MKNNTTQKTWFGKPIYHYQVKKSGDVLYKCTSTAKYQDDVLIELVERFRGEKNIIRIFRNNEEVAVLNRQKKNNKIYCINP